MNNYEAAGQLVHHAHWHLIPRYKDDGLKLWPQHKYSDAQEMEQYAQKIKAKI
jgi:histidine triad (HIT) family protein